MERQPQGTYRPRVVDAQLDDYLASLPAVAIDGAKAVGKTATASRRAATTFALDTPAAVEALRADPTTVTSVPSPVLIDEWQRHEPTWDVVRRAVDAGAPPGSYLLTGSASPAAPQTHSGAGRIVSLRMRPLTLPERGTTTPSVSLAGLLAGVEGAIGGATAWGLPDYVEAILAGGFPGMQGMPSGSRGAVLEAYVHRIVDRDFPEAGRTVRNPAALRRWLVAFARATGTTASFETIRDAAATGQADPPAKTTAIPYRDTLERIWVSDPVPAWIPTRGYGLRRLTSAPKHFLTDPALAATLLRLDTDALLTGRGGAPGHDDDRLLPRQGTILGGLFESLAALSLHVFAQAASATLAHLRTRAGEREVDFVVNGRGGRTVALEAKLTQAVDDRDVRHLLWLKDRMGPDLVDMVILTTGQYAYRREDGVAVVPLALLGA